MLTVTPILTGIFLVFQAALSVNVGINRARREIDFGDGGDPVMHRIIRAHGNFIEYVPVTLLGLGIAEFLGVPTSILWLAGGALLLGRLVHAAFMLDLVGTAGRAGGAGLTTLVQVAVAGLLIAGAADYFQAGS